ncbi:MAG: sugar transferase [Alphaproteobacteria bacterium]
MSVAHGSRENDRTRESGGFLADGRFVRCYLNAKLSVAFHYAFVIMKNWYSSYGKRTFDVLAAALLLIAIMPLGLIVGFAVRIFLGSPVLFTQCRGGYRNEPFQMVKFRSMTNARDAKGDLLPDDQRLTRFGRFLRATSIDELPQLWHVLCGKMSLIGPRPFVIEYMALYTPEQKRRHDVRPGITGLAQVMGRNNLSWDEKFSYDLEYVDSVSFRLDMKILLRTFGVIVCRSGVSARNHPTMPTWQGSDWDNGDWKTASTMVTRRSQ